MSSATMTYYQIVQLHFFKGWEPQDIALFYCMPLSEVETIIAQESANIAEALKLELLINLYAPKPKQEIRTLTGIELIESRINTTRNLSGQQTRI